MKLRTVVLIEVRVEGVPVSSIGVNPRVRKFERLGTSRSGCNWCLGGLKNLTDVWL